MWSVNSGRFSSIASCSSRLLWWRSSTSAPLFLLPLNCSSTRSYRCDSNGENESQMARSVCFGMWIWSSTCFLAVRHNTLATARVNVSLLPTNTNRSNNQLITRIEIREGEINDYIPFRNSARMLLNHLWCWYGSSRMKTNKPCRSPSDRPIGVPVTHLLSSVKNINYIL